MQLVKHGDGKDTTIWPKTNNAPRLDVGGLEPNFLCDRTVDGVTDRAVELSLHWL